MHKCIIIIIFFIHTSSFLLSPLPVLSKHPVRSPVKSPINTNLPLSPKIAINLDIAVPEQYALLFQTAEGSGSYNKGLRMPGCTKRTQSSPEDEHVWLAWQHHSTRNIITLSSLFWSKLSTLKYDSFIIFFQFLKCPQIWLDMFHKFSMLHR